MKLLINGSEIDKDQYSVGEGQGVSIQIQENSFETGADREVSVGNQITLTGAIYEIVKAQLIDDPNGKNNWMPVKIYEDKCCDTDVLLFEGIIRGDTVDWCYDDCKCTVNLIEQTTDTLALSCLKSTFVYDNWNGFQNQIHPRVVYCNELRPDFLTPFTILLSWIVQLILNILTPLVAVISVIYNIIGVIVDAINGVIPGDGPINWNGNGFDGDSTTSILQEWQNLQTQLLSSTIGCGRKHPSPFVRSYIQNVCDKCGIQFSSTIFKNAQSQYYNTMYLSAPVEKGTRNNSVTWINENRPAFATGDLFLDSFKTTFNADWKIINGVLYFERKDFFWTGTPFVNYLSLDGSGLIKEKLCLSWRDEPRPAAATFKYSLDAMDAVGNEANGRFNEDVSWNIPYSPIQSGLQETVIPFSTPRFRDDGIDADLLAPFEYFPGTIGNIIGQHKGVLIMHKGVCFNPKLLIWDGQQIGFARTKKYNIPGYSVPANQNYNFPYNFTAFNLAYNVAYPTDQTNTGLYARFHTIDNPKIINDQGKEFEFSFYYNCQSLQGVFGAKYVTLPMGTGRINNLTVNLDDQSIQVSGYI